MKTLKAIPAIMFTDLILLAPSFEDLQSAIQSDKFAFFDTQNDQNKLLILTDDVGLKFKQYGDFSALQGNYNDLNTLETFQMISTIGFIESTDI